jgi:FKBP-type peptidyl-prolyl cis-trans isomerase (trigger factor)
MKTRQLDEVGGRKTLQVEAPWSEIEADYCDLVERYSKVRLPGFRPGKAPQSVIEQRFRREIMEDLAHRCAERLGREAVRETGIEALGPVEAETIECVKDNPFRFQVRFYPMPEIVLPDIGSLKKDDDNIDARDWISRRLLDLMHFDLPDELVKDELTIGGVASEDPQSPEWKAAEERVRLMLILKRIARQKGIEVEEADVDNRIVEKAKEFGTSKNGLKEELAKGGGMSRLEDMLLAENTLDFLIEKVRGDERNKCRVKSVECQH